MSSPPGFPASKNKFSLPDSFTALGLLLSTLTFVYIFHFDVYVTSDSAWTAIAEMKLLKKGFTALFDPNLSHGMTYLFSYYAFYYGLLKTALFQNLDLMHRLNLLNGFVFSANIVLLYFLLRTLALHKTLSFFLSLLYLLIPKVFLLSLYVNPNALSLSFFLGANIFWVLYLKGHKLALFPIPFLCLISILVRMETVLFFTSFIAIAVALKSPLKRLLLLCPAILFFALGGAWLIQKNMYASYEALQTQNYRSLTIGGIFSMGSFYKDAGCIAAALGAGLTLVTFLALAWFYRKKQFRPLLSFFIWFGIPALISLIAAAHQDLTRFLIPAFLAVVILLGFFIQDLSKGDLKLQYLCLILIYAIHFLAMPLSYHATKVFYPLKRHYKQGERIVIEWIPLGNIFEDIHYLKLEKRREWREARRIVESYRKVIVLSNNVYRIPFYYFLKLKGKSTKSALPEAKYNIIAKEGGREFVFLDILPEYDRAEVFSLLSDKRFLDFKIYFPPLIPERVPELHREVEEFCETQNDRLIPQR